MILYYDTETSGFVQPTLPPDHAAQPHLVQLGAILADDAGNEVQIASLIVKPESYKIPEQAAKVHGITTEIALAIGLPLVTVLSVFYNMRAVAQGVVAFNADFDDLVMAAQAAKLKREPKPGPRTFCCMRAAGPIMNLPPTARMKAAGFDKWKPPNLAEAHQFFCGEGFAGAHGALADARACMRVHRALLERENRC
jgi:DNA polymerase-3 subunit epsilon